MKNPVAVAFGGILLEARLRAGLSQEMLAELAEIDRTYPSLLERGLRQPTIGMLFRLAVALHTAPEYLVMDTLERLNHDERLMTQPRRSLSREKMH